VQPAVPKPTVSIELFEGPLDLLLQLIEQQRLDITAIALADVADQYLATVRALAHPEPAILAEFLVIGAKLLVIKTRALLPRPSTRDEGLADEDLGDQLARQLREYQRFKQVALGLKQRESRGLRTYLRQAVPATPTAPIPAVPPQLDIPIDQLRAAAMRRLLLLQSVDEPTVALPRPKVLTVAEVTVEILSRLGTRAWITFDDLLGVAVTRNEVIVTLWTVLELVKRHAITIEQPELFDPITLGRGPAFGMPAGEL
jgi:segregation and condensation protein A